MQSQGRTQDFYWGQDRRAEGREWGGFFGEGAATPSSPARRSGSAVSSPAGFRAEPRPPKSFPLFSALRMPFLTLAYNIVNCGLSCSHGGGKTLMSPLRTPLDAPFFLPLPFAIVY